MSNKLLLWIAAGVICHAIFIGPRLDLSSLDTWAWLFMWPMMAAATNTVALIVLSIAFAASIVVRIILVLRRAA